MSKPRISRKRAQTIVMVLGILAIILAIGRTFFEQDLSGAIIGISSASVMYYAYRNPEMLMSKSFDEFGELYDNSRDKKYLWGFPLLQAIILFAILYIYFV